MYHLYRDAALSMALTTKCINLIICGLRSHGPALLKFVGIVMVLFDIRERTEAEYRRLLEADGLRATQGDAHVFAAQHHQAVPVS